MITLDTTPIAPTGPTGADTVTVITAAESRRSTTPNGTMTTLASPTQGGAASSLWLVEMNPGAIGPVHAFDAEVLWSTTAGEARLLVDGVERLLTAGDTVVLPAGVMRQLVAGPDGFTAVATTAGRGEVTRDDGSSAGVPPWVA